MYYQAIPIRAKVESDEKSLLYKDIEVCGIKTTRARLIWLFNLFCFAAHIIWVVVCVLAARGKGGKMNIDIFRPRNVWNSTDDSGDSYDIDFVDNNMPIRIDVVTIGFFALSALAHLGAVIAGLRQFRYFYWDQMDRAFFWWRWLEYSLSAPVMILGIALVCGTRDQATLASVVVLMWTTIAMGFLTEIVSTPSDDLESWIGDAPRNGQTKREARQLNYFRRMLPHVVGIFPYMAAWSMILYNFMQNLDDTRETNKEAYEKMPRWVYAVIFGSFAIFTLFVYPQIYYQWQKPKYYYQTEFHYCFLSLLAKSYLGMLLYVNVLRKASVDEAL
ncbi:MAG: hypothetical protein CMB11_00875 [Euryarchaeota archaeon]|nr:hypothetical protein [Euryarchaeota archaeon]